MEPAQRCTAELVRDLEIKSCEKCLREVGMVSLKKRMLRGDLVALYKHLKRGCEQVRVGVFPWATKDRTRGNGLGEVQVEHQEEVLHRRLPNFGTCCPGRCRATIPGSV